MSPQQTNQAQAIQLFEDGHIEKAKLLFEQLIRQQPNNVELVMNLATAQERSGDLQSAELTLRRALNIQVGTADIHFRLGLNLRHQGRPQDAILSFRQGLELAPDHAAGHNGLGELLYMLGERLAAVEYFQHAQELDPGIANYHFNLGVALYHTGRLTEPLEAFQKALALDPDFPLAHCRCGDVLISMGRLDEAMAQYDQAATMAPELHAAITGQAMVWSRRRRMDKAISMLAPHAKSLTVSTSMAHAYGIWVTNDRDIQRATTWIEHLDSLPGHADSDRAHMLFALGRLYDHCAEYNKAFHSYDRANALRHASYSPDNIKSIVNNLLTVFSKEYFAQAPRALSRDCIPIFIVGMPRSGSSLVEQILASHPLVNAAGEQLFMPDIASQFSSNPGSLGQVSTASLNDLASAYLKALGDKVYHGHHFTDKLPLNFMNLGLIALLFPQAKIIHARRNAVDTCLSCFYQSFPGGHSYAFSLKTLGHFYTQYRRVMTHWAEVLPLPVFDLDYEKLVASPEQKIRELLKFCDLSFDADCLNFHENQRVVSTASSDQVVRPLYRSSVNRWQLYREHLQPLFSELGDQVLKEYGIDYTNEYR